MYNCEIWTLTKGLEEQIDIIQRQFIRRILNIRWYDRLTNEEVYSLSKCTEWSHKVKRRRISWFGHLCRLPKGAPAKLALFESLKPCEKPVGRPKTTWIQIIKDQLQEYNIETIEEGYKIAQDRDAFKTLTREQT